MTRPLIGVTGRRWPASQLGSLVPKGMAGLMVDLHFTDYVHSIALAGGLPVELTRDADPHEARSRPIVTRGSSRSTKRRANETCPYWRSVAVSNWSTSPTVGRSINTLTWTRVPVIPSGTSMDAPRPTT